MSLRKKLIYLLLDALKFDHHLEIQDLSPEAYRVVCEGVDRGGQEGFTFACGDDKVDISKKVIEILVKPYLTPMEARCIVAEINALIAGIQHTYTNEKDEAIAVYLDARKVLGGHDV